MKIKKSLFHNIIKEEVENFFLETSSMAQGMVAGGPKRPKKRRSIVKEGGNAIEGAIEVTKRNFNTILKNLGAIIPKGVDFETIGSGGKKEISGDVDVIIDLEQVRTALGVPSPENKKQTKALGKNVRIELEKIFQQAGLRTKKSGISVHVGIPTGEGDSVAQVDLMVVPNAKEVAPLHQHDYSENPEMKGSTIHGILAALTRAKQPPEGEQVPEGQKSYYKLSPYVGLMTRSPSVLVTSDKDEIAKHIMHPQATAKDLSSVRNMLRALKRLAPDKYQLIVSDEFLKDKIKDDLNIQESIKINEAKVGREYQHLEDLLIVDGSEGGLEALELLEQISKSPEVADFKWDGGASVYWGRDEKGRFIFAPQNQWNKNLALDREGLASEIENTGRQRKGESTESFVAGRRQLADKYRKIWDVFEAGTPKNFKGFLNGDIMFDSKQIQDRNGNYTFTPNKVTYTVASDGLFGKMPTAEVFVVVHGIMLTPFGTEKTGNLIPVKDSTVMRFNKTKNLIVLPTQKPKIPPLDPSELARVKAIVHSNSHDIDLVSGFSAPRFSNFKGILYTYAINRAKDGTSFISWLDRSKLSDNQKNIVENFISKYPTSFEQFWEVYDELVEIKISILNKIFSGHGEIMYQELGITASIGDIPGGEGIVIARKGGGFGKLINPAFRKAGLNPRFQPVNEQNDFDTNKIVISWGRGMGHEGHMALARAAFKYAEKTGAKPLVLLSKSFNKKNPLPPEKKLEIYHKVFPGKEEDIMIAPEGIPSIFKFLGKLKEEGHYQDITVIVGADQVDNFKGIEANNDKERHFEKLIVISRQEAVGEEDPEYNFEGPRATNMRNILKDPEASEQEEFMVWRDAMPDQLDDDYIKELITIAKENMGLLESKNMKRKEFLEEQILRGHVRKAIHIIMEKKKTKKLKKMTEKQKLRSIIKQLIKESNKPEASPHQSTGINVLEDLLKKIIPVIEQDYKQLTTDAAQRESFRAHIISAAENTLAPEKAMALANPESDLEAGPEELTEAAGLSRIRHPDELGDELDRPGATTIAIKRSVHPHDTFIISKNEDGTYNLFMDPFALELVKKNVDKTEIIQLGVNMNHKWWKIYSNGGSFGRRQGETERRAEPRSIEDHFPGHGQPVGLHQKPPGKSKLTEQFKINEVEVDVGDKFSEKPEDDADFINIDGSAAGPAEASPEEEFGLDGEEITGRNFAFSTFQKIENQIIDSYSLLDNKEDRSLFFSYLITNFKLYFDKFEDELRARLQEPTTPEYEQEKSQQLQPGV